MEHPVLVYVIANKPKSTAPVREATGIDSRTEEVLAGKESLQAWDERRHGPMKYKVVLQHSEEGYSVSVPGLPGCWSQGVTEEEAIENIRDAIQEYLAAVNDLLPDAEVREIEVAV
jgi:predicted RNase H-like HicB family nuclease